MSRYRRTQARRRRLKEIKKRWQNRGWSINGGPVTGLGLTINGVVVRHQDGKIIATWSCENGWRGA